jgi:hypothetical protein
VTSLSRPARLPNLGTKRREWDTLSEAEVMLKGGMEPALEPLVGAGAPEPPNESAETFSRVAEAEVSRRLCQTRIRASQI